MKLFYLYLVQCRQPDLVTHSRHFEFHVHLSVILPLDGTSHHLTQIRWCFFLFSLSYFTFLMFRKLNKPQLTKIKQQNFIGIRAFDSRLYLDISRSFKWKESFIYRLIHGHFHIGLVIIPRPPYWPEMQWRAIWIEGW